MLIKGGMGQRGCSQTGTNGEKWPKWNFQANGMKMG